jgi:hypothetical protein
MHAALRLGNLSPLLLVAAFASLGCDPVGVLRVYAVKDGPNAERIPANDAQAWMECPSQPGQRHALARGREAGELYYREIPAISPDCVLFVRQGQGPTKRFRAGDLCVDHVDRGGGQCRSGFLYTPLPEGAPTPEGR